MSINCEENKISYYFVTGEVRHCGELSIAQEKKRLACFSRLLYYIEQAVLIVKGYSETEVY